MIANKLWDRERTLQAQRYEPEGGYKCLEAAEYQEQNRLKESKQKYSYRRVRNRE